MLLLTLFLPCFIALLWIRRLHAYLFSLEDALLTGDGPHIVWHPAVLLLFAAVPAPLVDLGAIETELFGEHDNAIRVKSGVLLVLAFQHDLLFLVQMAPAQALSRSGHRIQAAVVVERF